jgi:hypothetical protein
MSRLRPNGPGGAHDRACGNQREILPLGGPLPPERMPGTSFQVLQPGFLVCQDVRWVAFFPPQPATPGHTLVIPREHVPDVWSLDQSLGADLMSAVVRVGRAIRLAVTPAGMNS